MEISLRSVRERLRALRHTYHQVQGEATVETLRRMRVALLLALPLHLTLAFWFGHYVAPSGRPDLQQWAQRIGTLQWGMSALVVVLALAAHAYLRRRRNASQTAIALQATFSTVYLSFGAAASMADVAIGNGIATFILICVGMAAFSLMRPMFSLLVFGGACVVFLQLLLRVGADSVMLPSLLVQAISTLLVAQATSLLIWHQYASTVALRRQLVHANEDLLTKQRELSFLAEHDALTGLYNRREFARLAELELVRATRQCAALCIVMVDIDHFKRINDQHGHPTGDAVLRQVAQLLRNGVRAMDVVARLGGEEFIVLLPSTPLEGALAVAEKLRLALRDQPLCVGPHSLAVRASFGVSCLGPQQKASIDALYGAADKALYNAKQQGRDQVQHLLP